MSRFLIVFFLSIAVPLSAIAQTLAANTPAGRCSAVLELTGKDDSYALQQRKIRRYVYEKVCSGSSSSNSFDFNASGAAIIDLIPVQAGAAFANKQAQAQYFCSTYDGTNEQDLYSLGIKSTVVREAVASWEKCMLMNQRVNIAITAGAGPEGLLIEMSRGNENFQFQGVDVHSGDMTCNSSVQLKSTNGNSTYTATKNTNVDITDSKILSLTCTRKARQEAPGKFDFPPMAFSVVTDRGSLFLNLPDDKTGADYLSQWTAEKTELNTKINVLNSRQSRSWIACNGGQGVHQQDVNNPSCPANTVTGEARNFIYPGGGSGQGWKCVTCSTLTP